MVLADGSAITCAGDLSSPNGATIAGSIRPEKISVTRTAHTGTADIDPNHNWLEATVVNHIFAGNSLTYLIQWHDETLRVFVQNLSGDILPDGSPVTLSWKPSDTVVVSHDT